MIIDFAFHMQVSVVFADQILADAEAKAKAEEVAKRESEEEAIRQRRAKEHEERMATPATTKDKKVTMTAAKTQRSALSKFKKIRR